MINRHLAAGSLLVALIGAGQPARAQDDPLGVRWVITEYNGVWHAVWTRRGSANVFDGDWLGPKDWYDGRIHAGLTINIDGGAVTVQRYNSTDGNDCNYTGTLSGNTVQGTYSCTKVPGTFRWSAVIHQGISAPRPLSAAERARCADHDDAEDEIRARAMASQVSLEVLRRFRASLDDRYEAERRSGYAGAVVDAGALAAGWPLGKMAEAALREVAVSTLRDKLIKAGFKSIDKRLLKDAGQGRSELMEHLTKPDGISFDVLKAALKETLGEMGDPVAGAFDMAFFAAKRMKDMKTLEALRGLIRDANAQIATLEAQHARQAAMYRMARTAQANCLQRVQNGQAPDANDRSYLEVRRFLGG